MLCEEKLHIRSGLRWPVHAHLQLQCHLFFNYQVFRFQISFKTHFDKMPVKCTNA